MKKTYKTRNLEFRYICTEGNGQETWDILDLYNFPLGYTKCDEDFEGYKLYSFETENIFAYDVPALQDIVKFLKKLNRRANRNWVSKNLK